MLLSFAIWGCLISQAIAGPESVLSAPVASLDILSLSEFAKFDHPAFPAHGLRIKKTEGFCDSTVNTYTGYLDTNYGTKHLFFYFFESRNNPKDDDVIMWINGGPGGASEIGAFMELGPCNVDLESKVSPNGTSWNPHSWNNRANIFFLDQPINVGFSYADFGQRIYTTEEAAKDVHAFVSMFFDVFSDFKGRSFHLAGESYGGRYLPVFASEIYDQNTKSVAPNHTPINLQSILIGNGRTSIMDFYMSMHDMQCTFASGHPPVQSIGTCVAMKNAIPRCRKMLQAECYDRFDIVGCNAANAFCTEQFWEPYMDLGLNPYDIRQKCVGENVVCYREPDEIAKWLNLNSTRKLIGADPEVVVYDTVNLSVNHDFEGSDMLQSSTEYVAQLLERGVRVLVYVGETDFSCNWVGNLAWTETLEWSGHEAYAQASLHTWSVSSSNGTVAGKTKSAHGLTFLTIADAGHMVPHDKPVEALDMLNRWLAHGAF